ncbi:MAG: hypothetical protein JWQ38_1246 [Flavipsychrobacter sp.]|nr:hypothetical protein [Flavipsychrobacter sp.]
MRSFKSAIIFVLICSLPFKINAQIAYYDAVNLRKYIVYNSNRPPTPPGKPIAPEIGFQFNPDSINIVLKILQPYTDSSNGIQFRTAGGISSAFDSNVFIHKYLAGLSLSPQSLGEKVSSSISSVGGINVTNFADGLAKFLVARFKQELTITFFSKFKNDIEKSKDLQAMFPETYKTLLAIDNIYQFNAYLNTLRESFIKDITNLYSNFKQLEKLDKYRRHFEKHPELRTVIENSFLIIDAYSKGIHPGKVIEHYDTANIRFKDPVVQQNLRSSVALLKLFSTSLKSRTDSNYWVPEDSVRLLFEDPISMQLYFGLIYQQSSGIKFIINNTTLPFNTILARGKDFADTMVKYRHFIEKMSAHTQEVNEYITELKGKKKSDIDYNDYYKLYRSSLDLLQDAFTCIDLPYINMIHDSTKEKIHLQTKRWFSVANNTGELYIDIRTKNYSSAIINAVSILDTVLSGFNAADDLRKLNADLAATKNSLNTARKSSNDSKMKVNKIVKYYSKSNSFSNIAFTETLERKKINSQDLIDQMRSLIDLKRTQLDFRNQEKLRGNLLKYGTFAATIATASNSDDVKNAIETIALPSGSARVKRESDWNISLNAYVGAFVGNETIDGVKNKHWINAYGVTAPVGIAISRGHSILFIPGKKERWTDNKGGWSSSLFISLIDVGAIAAFRMKDDTTAQIPTVQLKNIISPGVFYGLGIPKCPVSWNFGAQIGPNLRKVDPAALPGEDPSDKMYWRFSTSLVVDIPVLNFYTRSH